MLATLRATPRLLPHAPPVRPVFGTTTDPRLSIIIVNYLHWDDTARLVEQLRATRAVRDGLAEIVIIDNNSPWHPIIPRLRRMPGVSLRRWRRNRGFARAVNEGCRLSRGDWFLLLNPDTSVSPDFLEHVLDTSDYWPGRAGIIGFGLTNPDGTRQLSTGRFPVLAGSLARLALPRHCRKYTSPPTDRVSEVDWVTGCCLLVRRDCIADLGGLDASFFLYYEDVDLCQRARKQGWSVWFDPGAWIVHHRPLHGRAVSPCLRVFTRHALLTYAAKHWGFWTRSMLAGIIRLETAFRRAGAWWRGDRLGQNAFGALDRIVVDFQDDQPRRARTRLEEVVRQQDSLHDVTALDRHSEPQPA